MSDLTEHEWHKHYLRFRAWKMQRALKMAKDVYSKTGIDFTQNILQLMDDVILLQVYEKELLENDKSNYRTS